MGNKSEVESSRGIDFAALTQVNADDMKSAGNARGGNGVLGISVVNTSANGKRVKLTQALYERLGSPETLQFVPDDEHLIIGSKIPYCTQEVKFSAGRGKTIIYSSGFVLFLAKRFKLDFSDRSSMSFQEVEIGQQEFEGELVIFAKIKMAK